MENESQYASDETPREFTLELLQRITSDFSEEHELGRGGFGIVYKGVLDDGKEIAVKKLHQVPWLGNREFQRELDNLKRAKHENIVRLLGYCHHREKVLVKHNGKLVCAEQEERALCLEYLEEGSLEKHLSDECCKLEWPTCYKIIRGVCEGLNYLHNGSEHPIYHFDLKPANIFLDKYMTPRIGDFGMARLFDSIDTYVTRSNPQGTYGYMPSEYIHNRQISPKFDVFSLGVIIIQIMAGKVGYSRYAYISPRNFIDLVHKNWGKRMQATMSSRTSQEVKTCIEIALKCVETDREKRPTVTKIVDELNKIDTANYSPTSGSTSSTSSSNFSKLIPGFLKFNEPRRGAKGKGSTTAETTSSDGSTMYFQRLFTYEELLRATRNFALKNKLGQSSFSVVYKGRLPGMEEPVAIIRIIDTSSDQAERYFANEISIMSQLHHRNIINLLGWCKEDDNLLLIYETIENGSLQYHLYPMNAAMGASFELDWRKRHNILIGIASGLLYIHTECPKAILNIDIKADNVMLDRWFNAKLCDFGVRIQFNHTETSHETNNGIGTAWSYTGPAFVETGKESGQSDVYSFGVLLLEIVCSKTPIVPPDGNNILIEKVRECAENSRILDAADTRLRGKFDEEIKRVLEIGLRCVRPDRHNRLDIRRVLHFLIHPTVPLSSLSTSDHIPSRANGMGSSVATPISNYHRHTEDGYAYAPRAFTYEELARAAGGFVEIIGHDSFGVVYGGRLRGIEQPVAIKKILDTSSDQANKYFRNEIEIMKRLRHRNIISLVGWCNEDDDLLLIYELIENGNLETHLYSKIDNRTSSELGWPTRRNILIGIVSGLAYIQTECQDGLVHTIIRTRNVMLDRNFNAKLANIGLVTPQSPGTTDNDPAYMETGKGLRQSDAYSLGVLLLEIVCGEKALILSDGKNSLIEKVWKCSQNNTLLDAADTSLRGQCDEEIETVLEIGLMCVLPDRHQRPNIERVRDLLLQM